MIDDSPLHRPTRRGLLGTAVAVAAAGCSDDENPTSVDSGPSDANEPADPYRPRYHCAPLEGWMNDPNGMVYHEGVYHLFYQAGEERRRWDHATSEDLVHWEHHGTKLPVEDGIQQFSGGGVVDDENAAGFGEDVPVFAYTGHHEDDGVQDQRLAYSHDGGETIEKYDGNPVIGSDVGAFRDPNVFRYEPDGEWRMVVSRVESAPDRPAGIEIYRSDNLREWQYLSTYALTHAMEATAWECPDLYELPVAGTDERRWVLTVSADWDREVHHLGQFDGTEFTAARRVPADHGFDFYAGLTWSNEPEGRRLLIGWLSNWAYAHDVPDPGWQGVQSFPRRVTLVDEGDGPEIRQRPARELEAIRGVTLATLDGETVAPGDDPLEGTDVTGRALEIEATLAPGDADIVGVDIRASEDEATKLRYDPHAGRLVFDRSESGRFFSADEHGITSASIPALDDGRLELRLVVDRCSVEAFINDGRAVVSNLVYPDWNSTAVSLVASGGEAEVERFVARRLAEEA